MFDLIVNADDRATTIENFELLVKYFDNMTKAEVDSDNAKPILMSHVLTALLEASDEQEDKLHTYRLVHTRASTV